MFTKKRIALLILIALLIIAVPVMSAVLYSTRAQESRQMQVLTLWQIDGFEGGKGSRAQYLKDKSVKLFNGKNIYVNVISLSAQAAEANLNAGEVPDMVSCAPTFNAHLKYINTSDYSYKTWCYGSYCILALDENCTFEDVNANNTVANGGKDNLTKAAAVMCGLGGVQFDSPTNAYLQLLNGKYKYLFGTQRDIYRLKTREVAFSVKQVIQFNDLYQNISILTGNADRYETCKSYVEYITTNNFDVDKIGLLSDKVKYGDEMAQLNANQFENCLKYSCANEYLYQIEYAAANNDANKIKNLLK